MVPIKEDIRMKWCVAVRSPYTKTKNMYCCEDHFDLELDMLNWMEYKLIGSRIYMRKGVIPHKFINSPKPSEVSSKSQLSPTTRKRRSQSLEKLGDKVKRKFSFDRLSSAETSTIVSCEHSPEDCFTMKQIDSPSGTFLVNKVPMSHYFEQSSSGERDTDTQITYYELEPTSISKTYCDKQIQVNLKPKRRSICVGTSICSVRSLNPQFAKFLENQESRPEVQNKLSALLITPIQRVPRYRLLLTQLHQLTKPSEKDYESLTECLEKIDDAADHINKIVEDQENMQRLLELQRFLKSGEPIIIKPGRTLIKEGILIKMATKKAPKRKIKDELKVNSLKCLSIFPLSKCRVVEVLDKGCMRLICQEEELILYHDQFSETKIWIEKIVSCIECQLNDRKTLRKDSSSRRPVKRKDLHEYNEVGLSPGKPLKKRRLESDPNTGKPIYVSRRKPIKRLLLGTTVSSSIEERPNDDCTGNENMETLPNDSNKAVEVSEIPQLSKDVFVFGNKSNNYDFGVKVGEFLGGVGTSIKRLLGFRK
ncbi:hypothetical protein JTB14_022581 [Gonioctena quinquepunctata]|nr:hypothetical protein JTB14_022581 [Gonioctena quinquepunctata]